MSTPDKIPSGGMLYPSFRRVGCPIHSDANVVRIKGADVCPECYTGPLPHNRAARRRAFRRAR